jgi:3-hydroxymyristoyl/3-hydroxydecanoyl-(acyl carrier protein) dehydratase
LLDGERRQEIAAAVELSPLGWAILQGEGGGVLTERLRRKLSESFETVLLPRHFRFGALPRNSQGKIVLADLLDLFRRPAILLDGIAAKLLDREEGLSAALAVPKSYPRLDGHFLSNPVVPGVAQLHWAMHMARLADPAFLPRRVEAAKFHSILRPEVEVRIDVLRHKEGWKFDIETTQGRKVSSGRLMP